MKEDFLHYLWKFQKIEADKLKTTDGKSVSILKTGTHNKDFSGPDFFNAQLNIDGQRWAGNVEVHVKSSDWYNHNHQNDINYDAVILHLVWEYDIEVFRNSNEPIPTLELKQYISPTTLSNYKKLYDNKKLKWINCEGQISKINSFVWKNWIERLYLERLERKTDLIKGLLDSLNNNWEATCFVLLAKSFGGNKNGAQFLKIAKSIPFSILQKETSLFKIEALLFGQANMLNDSKENPYYNSLKKEYEYLRHKYNLQALLGLNLHFFRLRPSNFPTIRLSQLAVFYSKNNTVFSQLMNNNDIEKIKEMFKITTSQYWATHYTFEKNSTESIKRVSNSFVELVLLNTIFPLKFIFNKQQRKFNSEEFLELVSQLKPESNATVSNYKKQGVLIKNAMDTQALLTLKNEYCNPHKCMECAIGFQLINAKIV